MKRLALAIALAWAVVTPARANVPCSLPFNLTNGTIADASQVMANYNALVTCLANAAAAGVNSDITQLIGLTTPLSPTAGGSTVFVGGTSTGSANAQVVASTTPSGLSLTRNYQIIFVAGFSNSGATTLTAGGSTVNLYKQSTAGPVALTGGEIIAGQIVFAFYDGTQWEMLPPLAVTAGFGISVANQTTVSISSSAPPYGFTAAVNMGLVVSANAPSANLLQVCMTDQSGNTPSASSPVLIPFQSSSPEIVWRAVTSSTCIDTNAAGATLGTQNSVPFRLWIVAFDNAGTVVLGLWHSGAGASTPVINQLAEDLGQSSTAISAAATSAGVFYTPNGTTVSNKAIRILGSVNYSSGLATAGSYTTSPSVTMFGPGLKKPGDVVQEVFATSITPTSAINLVDVWATVRGNCTPNATASSQITPALGRPGVIDSIQINFLGTNAILTSAPWTFAVLDAPYTASAITYAATVSSSTNCVTAATVTLHTVLLKEIMG